MQQMIADKEVLTMLKVENVDMTLLYLEPQ